MKLTKHAQIRSRQRAISKEALWLITTYGIGQKVYGNATRYFLDKRAIDHLIHELKTQIQMMEKLKRVRVIVGNDDQGIITAYRERNSP